MEFHIVTEPIKTLKEFGGHYALIVLGIVTALAVEHWIERRRNAKRASEAEQAIQSELQSNRDSMASAVALLEGQAKRLEGMLQTLGDTALSAPGLADRAAQVISSGDLDFGLQLTALRRSAWDGAVAGGTLSHMKPARVALYARAYAAMDEGNHLVRSLSLGGHFFDWSATADAFQRGESKDVLPFAQALRGLSQLTEILHKTYKGTSDALAQMLDQARTRNL
jgi:hypothetical protein